MIVWLGYYPIAGAAVWHLIEKCFGTPVYHRRNPSFPAPGGGQQDWQSFYAQNAVAGEIVFVRTQFPPQDDNPAIYVVRNGRESILAYHDYHNAEFPEFGRTVIELILGFDFYHGDWTSNYRSWRPAERAVTLLLEYESVLQDPDGALREIAGFTGIRRPCLPWAAALDKVFESDPRFKYRAPYRWRPTQEWSQYVESLFWRCHGHLMAELGYSPLDPAADFCVPAGGYESFIDQVALARRKPQELICRLEIEVKERLSVISKLKKRIADLESERNHIDRNRTETIYQLSAELAQLRRARVDPRERGNE